MKMFIGGEWKDKSEKIDVLNPFDGSVVDTVPRGDAADVDEAIAGAVRGAAIMRKIPAFDRAQMLRKAADLMLEQQEELAKIVSSEEGKILAEDHVDAILRDAAVRDVYLGKQADRDA